jgi:2-hydroxychromene-2-carboxylate isomerase
MNDKQMDIYIDYKSPYAYLAIQPTWELERDYRVHLNWLPYTLDIPDYLGSARVDEQGRVIEEDRTQHQWRKVRYSYMDVRRYANLRGLTVRGPQKIWDSSIAAIGMLFAKQQGVFRLYSDLVYPRFCRRELDIEDRHVVRGLLDEAGAYSVGFFDYLDGEGRRAHDRIRAEAEAAGVFGVPTFVLDDEVFWGREHLSLVRLRLHDQGLSRPGVEAAIDVTFARR